MIPSYEQVETILKQLPISYYLKADIPVTLSLSEASYFDQAKYEICISYPQIASHDIPEDKLEETIRGSLYHEISHVILTPPLVEITIPMPPFNIVEDERIEMVMQGFYMNTNFKETLNIIAPPILEPTTKDEIFFNLVRHKIGSESQLEKLYALLQKHKVLTSVKEYQKDIMKLYNSLSCSEEDFNRPKLFVMTPSSEVTNPFTPNSSEEEQLSIIIPQLEKFKNEPSDLYISLKSIIASKYYSNGKNAESRPSYSGHLLAKRIANPRSNYKWFSKQGDGFLRNGKKCVLNLFIDSSGSFKRDEDKVNQMLRDLIQIEKEVPRFSFNLVTISSDCILHDKSERQISCGGTNCLTSKVGRTFLKLQSVKDQVYNLVLFDGIAICATVEDPITHKLLRAYSFDQAEQFRAFNTHNTVIISDTSNKQYLDEYCYSATIQYSKKYVEELKENIIKGFKKLFS